jgi:hypothetical protein
MRPANSVGSRLVSVQIRRIRFIRGLCGTSKAMLSNIKTTDETDSTDLHGFLADLIASEMPSTSHWLRGLR